MGGDRSPPLDASAAPEVSVPYTGVDHRTVDYGFLLGYIDLAFRGTQEYAVYQDLVLGPWEEVERPRGAWGLRQWRRTVEDRQSLGPSDPLGRILIRMDFRDRTKPRRKTAAPVAKRDPSRIVVLRVGTPRILLAVESANETNAQRLVGLAREVRERFRRQLD
ncbi:MAG: hypothetical protein L3K00_04945 [Thermoplasmata archaeon]|nr:hypothetical protein [Thermoplasmata archaeon]